MTLDVLGIGHALLDSIVRVDDALLDSLGFTKAGMFLVDDAQYAEILASADHSSAIVAPGGSSANTISTAAMLGLQAGFIGVVGRDDQGEMFEKEMTDMGVDAKLIRSDTKGTGHTVTLVTPDGERTFATYHGAASTLTSEHIDEEYVGAARIFHTEGYTFDTVGVRKAVYHAARIAKRAGAMISMDVSDIALVERHKEMLLTFLSEFVDVCFANEAEARALTGKDGEDALAKIADICDISVVTRGEHGSLIQRGNIVHHIDPVKTQVVNTLGAGDAYAAGILHGIVHNRRLKDAGDFASRLAASAVASMTAKPSRDAFQ